MHTGVLRKNPISLLSKWKIFDNLRRSFVPIALFVLLILGWTVLHSAWFWTLVVTAIIILPSMISAAWDLLKNLQKFLSEHISGFP
jgi:uncharacterized protein YqhQ